MYVTSRSNLVQACMNIYDTFLGDFYNEKYMESISDLDIRAQLEVSWGKFVFALIKITTFFK